MPATPKPIARLSRFRLRRISSQTRRKPTIPSRRTRQPSSGHGLTDTCELAKWETKRTRSRRRPTATRETKCLETETNSFLLRRKLFVSVSKHLVSLVAVGRRRDRVRFVSHLASSQVSVKPCPEDGCLVLLDGIVGLRRVCDEIRRNRNRDNLAIGLGVAGILHTGGS